MIGLWADTRQEFQTGGRHTGTTCRARPINHDMAQLTDNSTAD